MLSLLSEIRKAGFSTAFENQILGLPKTEEIKVPTELVGEFVHKVVIDIIEFNTKENYDPTFQKLLLESFLYCYFKGMEFVFLCKVENDTDKLVYNFEQMMSQNYLELLPKSLRFDLMQIIPMVKNTFFAMFNLLDKSQDKMEEEGITFPICIETILTGGLFLGSEMMQSIELGYDLELEENQDQVVELLYINKYNDSLFLQ